MLGLVGQMGIADGGQNGVMAEDLLYLDQLDAGFDQVRGVGVPQAVWSDLFLVRQQKSCCLLYTSRCV